MHKVILSVAVFIAICFAGAFVCVAGGVQWGTSSCGAGAFFTLTFAALGAIAIQTEVK